MLAQAFGAFRADPGITVFAAGVSNSQETRPEEFQRERDLLLSCFESFHGNRFVYFGSCGVANDPAALSLYLLHKLEMERIVISRPEGIVFRLPQVVGNTRNSHTLTNFLRDRILKKEPFQVWSEAERNLIDIEDVAAIARAFLEKDDIPGDRTYSIASEKSLRMIEIVRIFERTLGVSARFESLPKGDPLQIDASEALRVAHALGMDLGGNYAERVIRKYYSQYSVTPGIMPIST
ncbi:NAD-dependent epimerase/dehydratase family protein [Pseudoxanthomonas helianthi]|uniref:NAD-dependent epimerase/dehydratase family protein n=1 Tax=Pseudoxanthomonas helianthi TaxID=1453541 RepID=A0A940WX28_9GAMM|nr:NAD-dependent epimerase/dehydratase family protein [Pseudoxanthomonas helianthi]MBP3983138.1 NAD-dependent epimerase/dehydratase family protein [Pseudoxanthomonas helianthi]